MENIVETVERLIAGRKFKNTKNSYVYFFHAPMLKTDGVSVVVGDTNSSLGTGIIPISLMTKDGKTTILLEGYDEYIVNNITVPLSSNFGLKLEIIDSHGELFHLVESE